MKAGAQEEDRRSALGVHDVVGHPVLGIGWSFLLGLLALVVAPFDRPITAAVNPDRPVATLDDVAIWLDEWSTRSALAVLFTIFVASFLVRSIRRLRRSMVAFMLAWASCEGTVRTLKILAGRPRPCHPDGIATDLRVLFDHPDLMSFPSGHAAMAAVIAVTVHARFTRGAGAFLIWAFALAIGVGRIYIGAHYPSDVLAGAAVGWFMTSLAARFIDQGPDRFIAFEQPRRQAPLVLTAAAIVYGWFFHVPPRCRDAATDEVLTRWVPTSAPWPEVMLEPLTGPATRIAGLAYLRSDGLAGLAFLIVVAGIAFAFFRRRALPWLTAMCLVCAAWSALALLGAPGTDRRPRFDGDRRFWAFDLQSHLGDPHDGAMDLDDGLERFGRLGYDLVVPTWHDRWSRGHARSGDGGWRPIEFWGMEWSGGDPAERPLHLLLYNDRPEPADAGSITDHAELIREVHRAGGVVVASHFWRGPAEELPTIESLVAAGIDGFEVAGRNAEAAPEPRARQARIRRAVAEHGLLAFGNSDFHGRRGANHVWNLAPHDVVAPDAEGIKRLIARRPSVHVPVAVRTEGVGGPLAAPRLASRYLRELTPVRRAVWIGWILVVFGVLSLRDGGGVSTPSARTDR